MPYAPLMATAPRYPTDHDPLIDVRAAYGRFADFATVVGTQQAGWGGCWYADAWKHPDTPERLHP